MEEDSKQADKKILFIESSPTDMFAKMARTLSSKKYNSSLFCLTGDISNKFVKESYNDRISLDFKFFKINLSNVPKISWYAFKKFFHLIKSYLNFRRIHPDVVIVRTTPNWLYYIMKKYFRKTPTIYFPYDIRSFCYKDILDAKKSGVPKFEIKSEKWAFNNADGIMHKGEDRELTYLNNEVLGEVKIKSPVIHFLPYCLSSLIIPIKNKKTPKKEINLVFVGHIGLEKSWRETIELVLKNKIHLHVYGKTANLSKEESQKKKAYEDFLKTGYFHQHEQVDQGDLSKEISKYDYGIWMGYHDVYAKNIAICTGNKLASYLEAGIPIIYFKNHEYIGEVLKKYGAGIGVTVKDNLRDILEKQNYQKLLKNVENARKELVMEENVDRLLKFFDEVKKYSISK